VQALRQPLLTAATMGENAFRGTPVTIVFTLILSFLGFFAAVTCVTMYYYKRGSGRLERLEQLQQASERRETLALAARPAIWEVWADEHPKLTSTWNDLLVRLPFAASSIPFHS